MSMNVLALNRQQRKTVRPACEGEAISFTEQQRELEEDNVRMRWQADELARQLEGMATGAERKVRGLDERLLLICAQDSACSSARGRRLGLVSLEELARRRRVVLLKALEASLVAGKTTRPCPATCGTVKRDGRRRGRKQPEADETLEANVKQERQGKERAQPLRIALLHLLPHAAHRDDVLDCDGRF